MRFTFCIISIMFLFAVVSAQSEGGIYTKSFNADLNSWSDNQCLNAMVQPYTSIDADSTAATISTKYSTHYRLAQIRNLSGTMQRYSCIILGSGDTATFVADGYGSTGRIPFIRRVISGAIADSTGYDFLYR